MAQDGHYYLKEILHSDDVCYFLSPDLGWFPLLPGYQFSSGQAVPTKKREKWRRGFPRSSNPQKALEGDQEVHHMKGSTSSSTSNSRYLTLLNPILCLIHSHLVALEVP